MEEPCPSLWLQDPSPTLRAAAYEVISRPSFHEENLGISEETLALPEMEATISSATSHETCYTRHVDDIVLKGMKTASELLDGVTIADEDVVFHTVMSEIVSLQVQTVAHVPKSVRPLLAEIMANELQHAQFNTAFGVLSVSSLWLKRLFFATTWWKTETLRHQFLVIF